MTTRIILTVLGSDRPGLTQALAAAVHEAGGNWLESHLSHLGGKYVGSVLADVPDGQLAALEKAVRAVDASGLQVSIVFAGDEVPAKDSALSIDLVGQDRPGIVREVTSVLAQLGANIEDFSSGTESEAWSGALLFKAQARITLPEGISADQVQAALEAISGEIMVDFSFA
ncbi:MAG: glycine cleavage system protein R [Novosphingobium sp.]